MLSNRSSVSTPVRAGARKLLMNRSSQGSLSPSDPMVLMVPEGRGS